MSTDHSADHDKIDIRPAEAADMQAVTEIYGHHVLHGFASFETDPPALDEMTERWQTSVAKGLPYIVAVEKGRVVGYAYAGPYRHRRAYRFSVENSVYMAPETGGRGIGRRLLEHLIADCEASGCRQMVAIIGDSSNQASIALHKRVGFEETGVLRNVGFKRGRWVDTVIMQLTLGDGGATPPSE